MGELFVEALAVEVAVVAAEFLDVQGCSILVDLVVDGLGLTAITDMPAPSLLDEHRGSSAPQHRVHVYHEGFIIVMHQSQHLRLLVLPLKLQSLAIMIINEPYELPHS